MQLIFELHIDPFIDDTSLDEVNEHALSPALVASPTASSGFLQHLENRYTNITAGNDRDDPSLGADEAIRANNWDTWETNPSNSRIKDEAFLISLGLDVHEQRRG